MKMYKHLLTVILLLITGFGAFGQTTWSEVEWSSINASDQVIVTMTTNNGSGTMYALPNNGGTTTPKAVVVTYSSGSIAITTTGYTADNLLWNINTTTGRIYPDGTTESWLYTTNSNSGVRIGDNETNGYIWSLDGNYLKTNEGANDRWLGVYTTTPDWRAYKNITGNTANQVVKFYKKGGAPSVATPTFTPAGGNYTTTQNVSIACSTTGATIHYTTDGETPTESSTVYSTPIEVSSTTTIKAKAWKTGMTASSEASATYSFITPITIAQARVLATGTSATVQGVVTFIDGRNIFIQDNTAAIDLFLNTGTVPSALAVGDKVVATGDLAIYKGLVELSGINGNSTEEFSIISNGNTLPLAEKTLAEILADHAGSKMLQSSRVKVLNGVLGTINTSGNTDFTQNSSEMVIYKIPTLTGITAGNHVNVTCIIGCFTNPQLRVRVAGDVELVDPVITATPTSLTDFAYNEGSGPSDAQSISFTGQYLNQDLTATAPANFEISSTESGTYSNTLTFSPTEGSISATTLYVRMAADLTDGSYTGNLSLTCANTTTNVALSGEVTYVPGVVATPTFTPEGGSFLAPQTVSISCSTENAVIYYTTDGSTPTASSLVYEDELEVSTNTTIKAIATAASMTDSEIASETYSFPTIITIEAARALANDASAAVEGVVTFIDGRNVYIQDATAGIVLYLNNNTVPTSLAIGDIVKAQGSKTVFKGLVELTSIDGSSASAFYIVSSGNTLPLSTNTIAEINTDFDGDNLLQSTRLKIENATIGAINNSGTTVITQDGNTLNVYRIPTIAGMMEGDYVTITGIVSCYNTPQLRVNSADDVQFTHRPNLSSNPSSLSGFNYVVENGPSEIQQFTLSASYLTGSVSVIPSTSYEVSFVGGTLFTPENPGLITPPQSGNIYGLNVYIRLKAGLALGTYNEQILIVSQSADTVEFNVSGSVTEQGGGGNTGEYTRISNITDLTVGSHVIFAARYDGSANSYYAMENTATGKPTGVQFTSTTSGSNEVISSTIADDEDTYYWIVGMDGSNYTFTNTLGQTIGYSSGTNFTIGGDNTAWTVSSGTSDPEAMVPSYNAFTIVNANNTSRAFALNSSHNYGSYATSNMTGSNAASYNFFLDLFVKGQGSEMETVATPTFNPAAGTYYETQNVSISCNTEGATIYYTTDGSDPDETSSVYSTPISIAQTTTVKAIAYKEGMDTSSIASATYTIQLGVVAIFNQDWEGEMNGWTFINTEGTAEWSIASYNNNHYAYANGYNAGANVDWCISPAFNLNNYSNVVLNFTTAMNYTGPNLEVYFSNDYDGTTPATATWTPLTCNLSTGSWTWTPSGDIAMSAYSGSNCYIAFKYTSTESAAAGWELDDCLLVGSTSNPLITVTPNTLNGFTYVIGNGPSDEQSFTVSGMNLTADVTIAETTNYEISLTSGNSFAAQQSIVLTQNSGNVSETTVYARLKAGLAVNTYNEQISITSTGATNGTVTCNGSVTEEESNEDWRRIATVSELIDGCKVIIAARHDATNNSYYAMQALTTGKPEGVLCTSIMSGTDEIMPTEIAGDADTYYWNVGISENNYIFTNASGDTIGYSGSGTNFSTGANNSEWMIENATSGESAMVPNYAAFNITNAAYPRGFALNSSFKFGAYATSNNNSADYNFYLDIFMQGEGGTPTVLAPSFTPAGGTYYEAQNVSIACGTEGATIYYSTDSENGPWEIYSNPILVNESMSIWAYAEKDDYNNSAVVSAEYVINDNSNIIFNQDWEGDWNGWTAANAEGTAEWSIATYNNNHYAYINGYNAGANEDWLLSPAFDLDSYSNVVLTFKTAMNYTGNDLEVYFSNDYDGNNLSTATWQALSCNLSQGSWEWVESGDISMDDFDGTNCYIAFKYTCTDTEASAWEVDDIMLASGEAVGHLTATPNSINGLNYLIGEGPSESQSYTLTASNLEGQGNITATASEGFEISLDDATFDDEVEINYDETPATVYVRLKSDLTVGTYEGNISHICGDASTSVTLSGEVISANAPIISEEIVPMYIQGMNGTNNNRLPLAFRLTLSNLTPNATYRYINQIVDANDGATANGAGNIIFVQGEDFSRTTSPSFDTEGGYGQFTTDANGSYSGWFMSEATANTRFTPGNHVYMRLRINDGNEGTSAVNYFTTENYATVLNFGTENNEYQGTAIYGITDNNPKDFVFIYDNAEGTGRPICGTSIETTGIDYTSISQYANFYKNEVAGQDGHWGGIIPNVNENGVQHIAILGNEDGTVVDSYTNETGIWGDENTINPIGGTSDIIVLNLVGLDVQENAEANVQIWNAPYEILIANAENSNYRMTVFTLLGQPVFATEVYGQGTHRISHNLTKGLYIITLQNESTVISRKVVVK